MTTANKVAKQYAVPDDIIFFDSSMVVYHHEGERVTMHGRGDDAWLETENHYAPRRRRPGDGWHWYRKPSNFAELAAMPRLESGEWKLAKEQTGTHGFEITDGRRLVASGYTEEAAERIIRAVNAHDGLLNAVKVAFEAMTSDKADGMPVAWILEQAIAKAEGKVRP